MDDDVTIVGGNVMRKVKVIIFVMIVAIGIMACTVPVGNTDTVSKENKVTTTPVKNGH